MLLNTEIIRYFQKWGIFEEKVERQGKGAQNVWNEPIEPLLGPWVHRITSLEENHFSKLKNFEKHPYLTLFSEGSFPLTNLG